jgi:hypothetical protein
MLVGRRRWQFKDKAPLPFKVVLAAFAANVAAQIGSSYAIPHWFPSAPDALHSYGVFKAGVTYFVQPWLGKCLDYAARANYIFFALLLLILWFYRQQIERVD